MLLKSPHGHDVPCRCQEEVPRHSLGSDVKPNPLPDLRGVVRTCHIVEQESRGNLVPALAIRRPQILQDDVTVEVRELAHNGNSEPHVHLLLAHGCVQRVVHEVSDQSPEQPVIRTVAVHVGDGGRCMAEPVDEEGLEFSFGVMEAPCVQGVGLHGVGHLAQWQPKEGVHLREEVEEGEDEERAEVLEEEECLV